MKIIKYILIMAAAACLSVACQKEELVTFNPENVVAPVLHAVSDVEVTVDNKSTESLKFTWDAADFGVKTQVYYTLEMSANDVTVNLFSGVSGTSYAVSYDALNNKAFNDLGIESGVAGEVTFKLGAKLNVGEMYWATPVMATITPTSAEKVYPKLFVVGSYNGWAHDASNQLLFNFAEDDVTYQGVIDFGEDHSANEFKITGGGWGNDEHSAAGAQTEEASSVALVAGGGDNINAYKEKRYYHLTFNRSALSLSKSASFDQVGIIGLNGDWSNDIVMTFNPAKQRFYADVEVPEATEFKFRMDGGWDVNYGGDLKGLTPGGNNIAIEAGNYRIYFNMNNIDAITATLDSKMYGKEEPKAEGDESGDTPVENNGWGIVGTINGWGGDGADVGMTLGTGWLVAAGLELPEGAEIKFRLDGSWDVNFGGTWAADSKIDLLPGGDNFKPAAGTYDVYFNPFLPAAYFMAAGAAAPAVPETWGIVGTINGWGGDKLDWGLNLDAEGKYWVAKNVTLKADEEIKFRFKHDWTDNLGGEFAVDSAISLTAGGANMKTTEGTFDIYLDVAASKAYIMTAGKTPADAN